MKKLEVDYTDILLLIDCIEMSIETHERELKEKHIRNFDKWDLARLNNLKKELERLKRG